MNSLKFTFTLMIFPVITSAQKIKTEVGQFNKEIKREATHFYKENTNLSNSFIRSYVKLIDGRNDTLKAIKLIKGLNQSGETAVHRLMKTKLEWEFKEHLTINELNSIRPYLKHSSDSAQFYFLLANFFKDSMSEKAARRLGFVKQKSGYDFEEVDWKKMRIFRWSDPRMIESSHEIEPRVQFSTDEIRMKDFAILYYKKAIELNKAEFYYKAELLHFLFRIGEWEMIKQITGSSPNALNRRQKTLLESYNVSAKHLQMNH